MNRHWDIVPGDQVRRAAPADGITDAKAALAERLRRAVLTLAAQPDRERALIEARNIGWPEVLPDFPTASRVRFEPTAADVDDMLPALALLTWLSHQPRGRRMYQAIVARARGLAWWRIGQQLNTSRRTVKRLHEDGISMVYKIVDK